jgi:hypothetical protein
MLCPTARFNSLLSNLWILSLALVLISLSLSLSLFRGSATPYAATIKMLPTARVRASVRNAYSQYMLCDV